MRVTGSGEPDMRLYDFIVRDIDRLVTEWEAFAATQLPAAAAMSPLALRDHAQQILEAVAADLRTAQTREAQQAKSKGLTPSLPGAPETAAQTHAVLRARSGFDINQLAAEYRALRASVLRLWMDACPPDAFVGPRVLDATRCVSYLTIEAKGAIPEALRAGVGDRVYGCDVCQDVCPWNVRFARELPDDSPYRAREALGGKDARALARELLGMSQAEFSAAFKGSPMKRAKLRGLKRNAAVVLGNVGTADDVHVLERVRDEEPDEMVREHAAWALGRIARRAGAVR